MDAPSEWVRGMFSPFMCSLLGALSCWRRPLPSGSAVSVVAGLKSAIDLDLRERDISLILSAAHY